MRTTLFNCVNRIRFGLGYFFSFIYCWFISLLVRARYWITVTFFVAKKFYIRSIFFVKRSTYFVQAITLFFPSYFTRKGWVDLNSHLSYRIRTLHNFSIRSWLRNFADLKKKKVDFIELYRKRMSQLYIHLLARNWSFLDFDLPLFRRLMVHG